MSRNYNKMTAFQRQLLAGYYSGFFCVHAATPPDFRIEYEYEIRYEIKSCTRTLNYH